jgi:hypothetical protein
MIGTDELSLATVPRTNLTTKTSVDTNKTAASVSFDLYRNNILIQASINNSQPLWFVFDSGASINVINAAMAKRLGLTTKGSSTLDANGGTVEGSFIEDATISLSGVEAAQQTIAAVPLDAMAASFGRDVQGIIGNNFIQHFVVEIDYANHVLTFHDPKIYNLSSDPGAIELENHDGNPFMKSELTFTGKSSITAVFLIDTGSDGTFSINRPFAERHQLLKLLPKTKIAEGVGGAGVGGDTKSIDARISNIRVGRYTLNNPVVSISQDVTGTGASEEAGFIGTDLLRRFAVVLDYQSQRILLKPNSHFKEPFMVDLSGLELVTQANDFKLIKIKRVRANFPAAQAALREGDIITAINGHPATEFTLDELGRMFKEEGKEYLLRIRRGNKIMNRKLKLKKVI